MRFQSTTRRARALLTAALFFSLAGSGSHAYAQSTTTQTNETIPFTSTLPNPCTRPSVPGGGYGPAPTAGQGREGPVDYAGSPGIGGSAGVASSVRSCADPTPRIATQESMIHTPRSRPVAGGGVSPGPPIVIVSGSSEASMLGVGAPGVRDRDGTGLGDAADGDGEALVGSGEDDVRVLVGRGDDVVVVGVGLGGLLVADGVGVGLGVLVTGASTSTLPRMPLDAVPWTLQ